jgi:hypothetical protein
VVVAAVADHPPTPRSGAWSTHRLPDAGLCVRRCPVAGGDQSVCRISTQSFSWMTAHARQQRSQGPELPLIITQPRRRRTWSLPAPPGLRAGSLDEEAGG